MSSGRITARTWSGRNRPSAVSSGRSWRPATTDAPATSFWKMWLSTSRMTSAPGWVWLRRAQRLPIVPLGTKSDASLPTICAARSCRRWMVGSSSQTSSPTSAVAMAARIDSVGNVKVSLRSSTVRVTIKSLSPELRVDQRSGSDHVRDRDIRLPLDIHLHPSLQGARGQVGGGLELLRVADHEQRERRAQASSADQLVIGAVEVVDQQRHAGVVLGGEGTGHRGLRSELDHDEKPECQPDQADHDQPLGPCRAIS